MFKKPLIFLCIIILTLFLEGCGGLASVSNPTPAVLQPSGKVIINSITMNPSGNRKFALLDPQKVDYSRWDNIRYTTELELSQDTVIGGVAFRVMDNVNYYYLLLKPAKKAVVFGKMINGVEIELISTPREIAIGASHVIEITARGNGISAAIDQEPVFLTNDSQYSTGGVGLIAESQGQVIFKNVEVDYVP